MGNILSKPVPDQDMGDRVPQILLQPPPDLLQFCPSKEAQHYLDLVARSDPLVPEGAVLHLRRELFALIQKRERELDKIVIEMSLELLGLYDVAAIKLGLECMNILWTPHDGEVEQSEVELVVERVEPVLFRNSAPQLRTLALGFFVSRCYPCRMLISAILHRPLTLISIVSSCIVNSSSASKIMNLKLLHSMISYGSPADFRRLLKAGTIPIHLSNALLSSDESSDPGSAACLLFFLRSTARRHGPEFVEMLSQQVHASKVLPIIKTILEVEECLLNLKTVLCDNFDCHEDLDTDSGNLFRDWIMSLERQSLAS